MLSKHLSILATIILVGAAGCTAAGQTDASDGGDTVAAVADAPAATGTVITVEMITDGAGNFFKPAEIQARRGDVIRYVLTSGVHNVNFVADSNAAGSNLPALSPLLQLPGQTYDVPVNFEPGRYYFQCDPHALLGMVGHVTVTP
jgi:plastocyanin